MFDDRKQRLWMSEVENEACLVRARWLANHICHSRFGDTLVASSGCSSVVRASDSRLKCPGFESPQERRENFLLQGRLSVLTFISVHTFHPHVSVVARERSRSFYRTCRWRVTAKHAPYHTPSIAFRHLPPNSARFSYATEGALFISAQLSTDADSALRKVWVLIRMWKQPSAQAHT